MPDRGFIPSTESPRLADVFHSGARRCSSLPGFRRIHNGTRHMIRKLRERRHLALLVVLVVAAVVEPLSVGFSVATQIIGGIIVITINLGVFLIIFEKRWERRLALAMIASILGSNIAHEASSDRFQLGAIVFHCVAAAFLAFAVA